MQSVQTLRRAGERSMRGLRNLGQGEQASPNTCEALRELLADFQADMGTLRILRNTADELLRDGMEAEAMLHFCEDALAAAEITLRGLTEANQAQAASAPAKSTIGQMKQSWEDVHAICAYFRHLAESLRAPLPPLPAGVFNRLEALPAVNAPRTGC